MTMATSNAFLLNLKSWKEEYVFTNNIKSFRTLSHKCFHVNQFYIPAKIVCYILLNEWKKKILTFSSQKKTHNLSPSWFYTGEHLFCGWKCGGSFWILVLAWNNFVEGLNLVNVPPQHMRPLTLACEMSKKGIPINHDIYTRNLKILSIEWELVRKIWKVTQEIEFVKMSYKTSSLIAQHYSHNTLSPSTKSSLSPSQKASQSPQRSPLSSTQKDVYIVLFIAIVHIYSCQAFWQTSWTSAPTRRIHLLYG